MSKDRISDYHTYLEQIDKATWQSFEVGLNNGQKTITVPASLGDDDFVHELQELSREEYLELCEHLGVEDDLRGCTDALDLPPEISEKVCRIKTVEKYYNQRRLDAYDEAEIHLKTIKIPPVITEKLVKDLESIPADDYPGFIQKLFRRVPNMTGKQVFERHVTPKPNLDVKDPHPRSLEARRRTLQSWVTKYTQAKKLLERVKKNPERFSGLQERAEQFKLMFA
eukprot:scaffold266362_cov14-Prasinocladus_malaysianus.AAC.2